MIQKDKDLKRFRGRIAKFQQIGVKDIMLILDVEIYEPDSNTWVEYRDHLWMDSNRVKDRTIQGKSIVFYGKEYEYFNSIGKKGKIGVSLKYPNSLIVIKKK